MHYRYLLVLEASQEELTLIRTADGESSSVTQDAIDSGQFKI
jgi:hypothetical protein